jgi:ribosomal protein S18 acetylase RimI-like enzyme
MHTATGLYVRTLPPHDLDRCATLITLAFASDAPSRWLWPDRVEFLDAFPRFVRAFGGAAFREGTAFATDDFAGAALWNAPGAHTDDDALIALLDETLDASVKSDAFHVFEQMASFHPKEPHWHLTLIGVDPIVQGRGVGGALLRHGLEQCDRHGMTAYLEGTSARNAALYARHGFERVGTIQAGNSPEIFPMVRGAR